MSSMIPKPTRMPADLQALTQWVQWDVEDRTGDTHPFTAWDVTRDLRDRYPDIEIVHDQVRGLVHEAMEEPIAKGEWHIAYIAYPDGNTARTFVPGAEDDVIVVTAVATNVNSDDETDPQGHLLPPVAGFTL